MRESSSFFHSIIGIETVPERFSEKFLYIISSFNPYSRLNAVGHITASGLVIKNDQVLLIFHPFIKEWFQPGGHIDDGELPIEAAIREVYEETGVVCKPIDRKLDPIDIDLHEIAANPKKGEGTHLHIDLLFLLEAVREDMSAEKIMKSWLPFDEVTNLRLRRALEKLGQES